MKALLVIVLFFIAGCSTPRDTEESEFFELLHHEEFFTEKTPTPMEDWPIEVC